VKRKEEEEEVRRNEELKCVLGRASDSTVLRRYGMVATATVWRFMGSGLEKSYSPAGPSLMTVSMSR